jgi:hypothetical protein
MISSYCRQFQYHNKAIEAGTSLEPIVLEPRRALRTRKVEWIFILEELLVGLKAVF